MRAAIVALVLLCACSSSEWARNDTYPEEADRDLVDCQRFAGREASLRADGFYGPSYGPFPSRSGNRMLDEANLTDYCMRSKGYQRGPKS